MTRSRQKPTTNGNGAAANAASRRNGHATALDALHIDLGRYLPFLINRVGEALVERFSKEALATHGLSIGMWRVLAALSEQGVQRQIDLSTATSIEASTLSRLVTRLVRMRLVTRRRSETSNREVLVQLAPHGTHLLERLIPVAQALHDDAVQAITMRDQTKLQSLLRKMYANVIDAPRRTPAAKRVSSRTPARTRPSASA